MKLHPRAGLVARAKNRIFSVVCEIWQQEGLTPLEVVSVLAQLTAEYMKYPMREERHPNDAIKKVDEA
jgi:hypothetical protein